MNISCQRHPTNSFLMIDIRSDSTQRIVCIKCVKQYKISIDHLIIIKEIMEYDSLSSQIFLPIYAKSTQQFQAMKKESKRIEKEIEDYFSKLCDEIYVKINQLLDAEKQKIEKLNKLTSKLNSTHMEQLFISRIQQVLKQENPYCMEQALNQCITEYFSSFSDAEINNNQDQFEKITSSFTMNQAQNCFNNIRNFLEKIDFFLNDKNNNQKFVSSIPQVKRTSSQSQYVTIPIKRFTSPLKEETNQIPREMFLDQINTFIPLPLKRELVVSQKNQINLPLRKEQNDQTPQVNTSTQQQEDFSLKKQLNVSMPQINTFTQLNSAIPNQQQQYNNNQQKIIKIWQGDTLRFVPSSDVSNSKQSLQIQNLNNEISIIKKLDSKLMSQCYSKNELYSHSKYIIRLEIHNYFNQKPHFLFGLINSQNKDSLPMQNTDKICYYEVNGGYTKKIIRGTELHSKDDIKKIGKKSLEFRIHIENKIWKVSSYPDYLNVAELNSPNKINQNSIYHFAIGVWNNQDYVIMKEIIEVAEFDTLM